MVSLVERISPWRHGARAWVRKAGAKATVVARKDAKRWSAVVTVPLGKLAALVSGRRAAH